ARESTMFGFDWVYNFDNLKNNALLFKKLSPEEENLEQYKPKDHIFEIHKLVEKSSSNPEFSSLFYEVRHKTYSETWRHYRTQLVGDIAQQVFMTLTATALSMTVETIITVSTLGFGYFAAKAAATLTYVLVYTAMTKLFMDVKIHEAESQTRAKTFYPVSNDLKGPTSLNEKMIWDRFLQDSMAAALIGHPGGYYTTVTGGEHGDQYTGQLLVSPPNLARSAKSLGGLLELLWENFWKMGESDPDTFTALDFDNMNLNYFLLGSELPSYNHRPNYAYPSTNSLFSDYNAYALNTLGYLERKVRVISDNKFNAIRPTVINGRPQYEFINREDNQKILPRSGLYQPIVLSQERYDKISPNLGHIVIQVQCADYSNTRGVKAYDMLPVEIEAGYKAKVPINDNGFGYSVSFISIDVLKDSSYYAQDFIVNDSYYNIAQGNLYFSKSIEEIISEKYIGFDDALKSGLTHSLIYYKVHIYFDVFVPDTSDETHRLALTQATQHVIMDYFNQYTYAEVTANMISEIAYTETLTFWSTVISSAAIYFGSWAVGGGTLQSFAMAGVGIVKTAIKEVFEEIIKDSFIESLIENFFDIMDWSEDLAMWVSALATSAREVTGALGQLALSTKSPMKTDISLMLAAKKAGDVNTFTEIKERLDLAFKEQIKTQQQKEDQKKSRARLLFSGFFKGLFMVMPSILFGSFSFLTLKGLSTIGKGAIDLAPKKFAAFRAKYNAFKKGLTTRPTGEDSRFYWKGLKELLKKPSDLDSKKGDVNNEFKEKSENIPPPLVDILSSINSQRNVKEIQARESLTLKFNEIQVSDWIQELTQDYRFSDKKEKFDNIKDNLKDVGFEKTKKDIISTIKDALRDKKDLRYVDINGILMYDPNFVLVGLPHHNPEQEVDVIFNQPIKDFVNDLKRNYYTISYKIKLALLKNGQMIEIDAESNEDMAHWLIKNGYSKDETVYILPVDKDYNGPIYEKTYWVSGTGVPSPYTTHFDNFRKELKELAYKSGLIIDYTYVATSRLLYPNNELFLFNTYSHMSVGHQFSIQDTSLLTMHARALNKLEAHYKAGGLTEKEYIQYTNEINKLFNEQYSIYGFIVDNPFYFDGRLNAHKIGDILMDYGFIDKNELSGDLYQFVHPFGASEKSLTMGNYNRKSFKFTIPAESTYTTLKLSLEQAILDFTDHSTEINEETAKKAINEVNSLTDNFIQLIRDATAARDIFKSYTKNRNNPKVNLL
ncbi:MAG: hypothetical protein Lokiarch_33200, partial [Candidatus Lokiarchaeum sp. GC14_75]